MAAAPPMPQPVEDMHIQPTYILQPIGIPLEEAERIAKARTFSGKQSKIGMAMTGEGAARKRISVACNRCRKRKIRCTSSSHPKICEPCMLAGVDHECIYTRSGQKELTLSDLLRYKEKNRGVAASTAAPPAQTPAPVTLEAGLPLNYPDPQNAAQEYGQAYPSGQVSVPPSPSQSLLGQSYTLSTTDNTQYPPFTPSTFSQSQSQWSTPMTPTTPMTMGYGGSSYASSPYTPSPYQTGPFYRYSWNQPYYSIPPNPATGTYQTAPASGTQDLPRPDTIITYAPSYYPFQYAGTVAKPTQDTDVYHGPLWMNKPAEPPADATSDQNTITASNTPRAQPVSTYHDMAPNIMPVTPPARTSILYNTNHFPEDVSPKTQTFTHDTTYIHTNTNNEPSQTAIVQPEPTFTLPAPASTANGFNGLGQRRRSRSPDKEDADADADTASNASWRPALKKKRTRRRIVTKGRARGLNVNPCVATAATIG